MSENFTVELFALTEYASQDFQGRGIMAGIMPGVLTFNAAPFQLPMMQLDATIRPISKKFEFTIYVTGPDGKGVVEFDANYASVVDPDPKEFLVMTSQTSPVRFSWAGIYHNGIREDGRVILDRKFIVEFGPQAPIQLGLFNVIAKLIDQPLSPQSKNT